MNTDDYSLPCAYNADTTHPYAPARLWKLQAHKHELKSVSFHSVDRIYIKKLQRFLTVWCKRLEKVESNEWMIKYDYIAA